MSSALPFPWRSLDVVRRVDVGLLASMRRASLDIIDVAGAETALREMLGSCELSVRLRRVTSSAPRVGEGDVGILLTTSERPDPRRAFAVVLEHALATALASRALRRPAPRVVDSSARSPALLAGAMGALLVAAARRNAATSLRVLAAGDAHAVLGDVASVDPSPIGVSFTVLVDHDAYVAQAFAPRAVLELAHAHEIDSVRLAALGEMPLELPLVGAVLEMTATELATLSVGDALFPVDLDTPMISPTTSDVGFSVDVAEDGRVVLRSGPYPLVEETVDKDALAQAIGETPVVVRVEIGMAQMTAREWATIGSGDVVSLGKRIGEHVVLRVAGVEVARGELVDLDGEVGVRIVARSGETAR